MALKCFSSLLLVGILGLCLQNCTSKARPFEVEQASYQSWKLSETEMGTALEVTLSKVNDDAQFESIVFNRQQVSVLEVIRTGNDVVLKALVQQGEKAIDNLSQVSVNESNRVYYAIDGKTDFYQLPDWERKSTQLPN
ncbi:MAG: hypothetical protein KTR13_06450 [Saprospiraceae bacterium]|nr:hypothetical protein [Saprospiraceae bacterium]